MGNGPSVGPSELQKDKASAEVAYCSTVSHCLILFVHASVNDPGDHYTDHFCY